MCSIAYYSDDEWPSDAHWEALETAGWIVHWGNLPRELPRIWRTRIKTSDITSAQSDAPGPGGGP